MKKSIRNAGISFCMLAAMSLSAQLNKANMIAGPRLFRMDQNMVEGLDYAKAQIIFQVKDQYRSNCTAGYINDAKLNQLLTYLGVNSLAKLYPNHQPPREKKNSLGQELADLSLIYELKYTNTNVSLEKAINLMLATGMFNYADPRYQFKTQAFTPNDPNLSSQAQYLQRIKAYVTSGLGGAWDVSDVNIGPKGQGDTTIVIGIVDSGTDLVHPDLKNQFKHNYADPINGIDDDGDGYIDNFTGWDLAGADFNNVVGDNNPQIMGVNNIHGSHVSGDASAQTNNGVGVAGVGFKCKLLPVKCAADNDTRGTGGEGYIITGYEGITYAADHGARVINCSWGGTGGGSYGQSIITYASINKNSLVVCAAGNNNVDQAFFPAAYTYVLSVAASNANTDNKASFSNWNFTVDITTPGNGIYNTAWSSSYQSMSGTSMASPITAGGAALVLSKWPTYTGLQAGQRLIVTADNHYGVNAPYLNKLGGGRTNLYRALADPATPSVVFTNQFVTDHNDMTFVQGDTLFISGDFINYLNPTSSAATATISPYNGTGTYVTAIAGNTTYPLGVMATNAVKNNGTTPFKYIVGAASLNNTVTFQVKITDGTYNQSYFFDVLLNPDYVNIAINDVATTITSKGKIGWNADGASVGLGFSYLGTQILYEGGLMVGSASTKVSDCVRGTTAGVSDADFANVVVAQKVGPTVSDFDVLTKFNDNPAVPKQNLFIHQNAYAWTSAGSRKFVICEYIIKNTGTTTLTNLWPGIFADWDIDAATYAADKSDYDATRKMGYSWTTGASGIYAGIKLLTNTAPPNFYGIDNAGTGRGGINITSVYSKADKYTSLSTQRLKAGDSSLTTYPGDDVANVMSSGPFSINAGDSIKVAFALIAGDNLTQLQTSADTAQIRYNNIGNGSTGGIGSNSIQNFVVFPNPSGDVVSFVFSTTMQSENYTVSLVNTLGQTVKVTSLNTTGKGFNKVTFDVSDLTNGTYFYKVTKTLHNSGGPSEQPQMGKIIVNH